MSLILCLLWLLSGLIIGAVIVGGLAVAWAISYADAVTSALAGATP